MRPPPSCAPSARPGRGRRSSFAEQTAAIDDPSGPLGIRLVSQSGAERLRVAGRGPRLIFPLEASVVDVHVDDAIHRADLASWVIVPGRASAILAARSVAAHTLILGLSEALVSHVVATYPGVIRQDLFLRYMGAPSFLPRSNWVNEICHRYVFERAACGRRDNEATAFLETEIAKEAYFACHDRAAGLPCAPIGRAQSGIVTRARAHIEAHLFDADVLTGLTKACGASASSVLRAFRREVGVPPIAYLRARRLDQALLLLKSSQRGVGEISTMVGYRSLPAFSEAFLARFGRRPSDVRDESRRSSASAG